MKARRGRPPKNRPREGSIVVAKVVVKGDEKSGLKLTDVVLEEGVVHQFCSRGAEIGAREVMKESELLKRPVHPRPSGSCWVDVEVVQEDSSPYLAAVKGQCSADAQQNPGGSPLVLPRLLVLRCKRVQCAHYWGGGTEEGGGLRDCEGYGLPPSMLSVGDGITNHILQENLEDSSGLFVDDENADTLNATSPGQTANRRLGDPLDVVPQHLPVTPRSSLAQSLAPPFTSTQTLFAVLFF
ncbi:hypothetical protein Dimus_011774 [Dionaea muscipula]